MEICLAADINMMVVRDLYTELYRLERGTGVLWIDQKDSGGLGCVRLISSDQWIPYDHSKLQVIELHPN